MRSHAGNKNAAHSVISRKFSQTAPFDRSSLRRSTSVSAFRKFLGSLIMRRWIPSAKVGQSDKHDDDGEHAFHVFLAVSLVCLAILTVIAGLAAR